jgi:hypothetical protein
VAKLADAPDLGTVPACFATLQEIAAHSKTPMDAGVGSNALCRVWQQKAAFYKSKGHQSGHQIFGMVAVLVAVAPISGCGLLSAHVSASAVEPLP